MWGLLQEADRTAEANKEQSEVYDAMAQTLGEAWATLVSMLERRRELLGLTSEFFQSALEVRVSESICYSVAMQTISTLRNV